ncbi:MAG: ribulose-phosphate 3-epimerase [Puniceicoccales bacterium]|jgi:ribulose-phosphate 3-epimerase|nr:ribulose-phosphate 3-epimerase [Puniceicoccales bacterium]
MKETEPDNKNARTGPHPVVLAPSLLAGNHAALGESLAAITGAGLRWAHVDIMDGHFVPNLSFGPKTLADLRPLAPALHFDTHLMLSEPHKYIEPFARAGANALTIHIEAATPHLETLRQIHALGLRNGIALNPDTPPEAIRPLLGEVDLVLAMTVHPGFGGQHFIRGVLQKIETIARWRERERLPFRIEVDGGIGVDTAPACIAAGADTLVAGTAFFASPDRHAFCRDLFTGAAIPPPFPVP